MSNNGMIWIHPAEEKDEDGGEKVKSNEPVVVGTEVCLTASRMTDFKAPTRHG